MVFLIIYYMSWGLSYFYENSQHEIRSSDILGLCRKNDRFRILIKENRRKSPSEIIGNHLRKSSETFFQNTFFQNTVFQKTHFFQNTTFFKKHVFQKTHFFKIPLFQKPLFFKKLHIFKKPVLLSILT